MTHPSHAAAEAIVAELATFPGMEGCALVETDTGMVWYHAGAMDGMDRLGEAAIEFWRIQDRLSVHFEPMGPLRSAAYSFTNRVVALFPCSETPLLVLVCIAHKEGVRWNELAPRVGALQRTLRQARAGPVTA